MTLNRTILTLILLPGLCPLAWADNAVPLASHQLDDSTFVLFAHSLPLRAGPVHLEACLLQEGSGQPVPGATMRAVLRAVQLDGELPASPEWCGDVQGSSGTDGIPVDFRPRYRGSGLLLAADLHVPQSGEWRLDVRVTRSTGEQTDFGIPVRIAEALPPWQASWPWILPVPVGIVLYLFSRKRPR